MLTKLLIDFWKTKTSSVIIRKFRYGEIRVEYRWPLKDLNCIKLKIACVSFQYKKELEFTFSKVILKNV